MRKRLLSYFLLSLIILFFLAEAAAAETPAIKLVLNGNPVVTDVAPVLQSGRTLVPIRVIMENLGAQVDWSDKTETVTIVGAGKTIILKIGTQTALVDGAEIPLDVSARIIEKRTFVPLRFISEAMGAIVAWDEASFTVSIRTKPAELTGVEWVKDAAGTRLVLTADTPIAFEPMLETETNTLSIQLPRTVLAGPEETREIDDAAVRSVDTEQVADSVRVNIGLTAGQTYLTELSPDRKTLTLKFPARITGFEMVTVNGKDILQIATTGPLQFAVSDTADPLGIDLQLTGAVLAIPDNELTVGNGYINTVRWSQSPPATVTVTVNLQEKVTYRTAQSGEGISLTFDPLLTGMTLERDGHDGVLHLLSPMPLNYTLAADPATGGLVLEIPDAGLKPDGSLTFSGEQAPGTVLPFTMLAGGCQLTDSVMASITLTRVDGEPGKAVLTLVPARGYEWQERESEDDRSIIIELNARPLVGKTIVLDPGHGGSDVGAVGATGKYEKDANHPVAQILRGLLEDLGATVVMTNTVDNYLDGYARADIANNATADAFLSIHSNAFTNPGANGTETYYWTTNPKSKQLAENIHKYLRPATGLTDRGVKKERFIVIRETTMPSALVEIAFISNPAEEKLLFDPAFRQKVAAALRDGLLAFFGAEVQ
ncbi:MAG: N-acetylmuramoyl-L-alanine amidase [bacterium]|jgi:N-acetylmuramoyl-L-alanine amidase